MLYLSVNFCPAFGASPPVKRLIYALVKNAMLWRFCLRIALTLNP